MIGDRSCLIKLNIVTQDFVLKLVRLKKIVGKFAQTYVKVVIYKVEAHNCLQYIGIQGI